MRERGRRRDRAVDKMDIVIYHQEYSISTLYIGPKPSFPDPFPLRPEALIHLTEQATRTTHFAPAPCVSASNLFPRNSTLLSPPTAQAVHLTPPHSNQTCGGKRLSRSGSGVLLNSLSFPLSPYRYIVVCPKPPVETETPFRQIQIVHA